MHPLNRALISGGSSGGEGALVGARGSPLGIGTDIGGSIRIPAGLCGIYGLSPSPGRHPYERGRYVFILWLPLYNHAGCGLGGLVVVRC